MPPLKVTNVYVDGFNLYYGIKKLGSQYKWLDIKSLCQHMLPNSQINRIRYFTARVSSRPNDPNQHRRQQVYLRALRTIPSLSIHYGHFLTGDKLMPRAPLPASGAPVMVNVVKTEEKGSDVNLASYMLCDAFDSDYEVAAVISNDSDLVTPIELVRSKFRLDVVVLNPHKKPSVELSKAATLRRDIRRSALSHSQFSPVLQDSRGTIVKPPFWDEYVWCEGCNRVHSATAWVRMACPHCSGTSGDAWSVIHIAQASYPAIPLTGVNYPR